MLSLILKPTHFWKYIKLKLKQSSIGNMILFPNLFDDICGYCIQFFMIAIR